MKKKFAIPALVSVISASLVGAFVASFAWFSTKVTVTTRDNLTGSSDGSYFAYGDGTQYDDPDTAIKEGPYGIETPRQLYNLAWLQYLGYFTTPKYFELANDIDMTGWVLPPIGTTDNPFVSEFNGNGFTVSNLTVTNSLSEILATNKAPSRIKSGHISFTNVNVVGMFGVVGELPGASTSSSVTSVKDFTIAGASIHNGEANTLAGIAAGYVNGPLSNVAITDGANGASEIVTSNASNYSSFDSRFTNISNYGVVGFCEDAYINTMKNTVSEVYNATARTYEYIAKDEGQDTGWGGSIDMQTMYNGLVNVYNTYSNNSDGIYKYYTRRTIVEDVDGTEISNVPSNPVNNTQTGYTSGGGTYQIVHYGYEQKNSQNKVTASYTLARRDTSQYIYLYGHNPEVPANANETVTKTHYPESPAFYISLTVSGTTHYLVANNGAISDTTSSANATKWFYDDEGYIKTTTNNGDTYHYLTYNDDYNGMLTTTNMNSANAWSKKTNGNNIDYSFVDSGNSYHIYYDNGWTLKVTAAPYYYIRNTNNGNNYLSRNGTNVQNVTNRNNATKWYWSETGGYYYPEGDDSVGLVYYYRRNNNNATVNALYIYDATSSYSTPWQPNAALTQLTVEGKTYSRWWGESTDTYYVRYNNGWTTDTTSRTIYIETVAPASSYYVQNPSGGTMKIKTTETYEQPATYETKHTYFPLRQENNNGVPMETNTGYVISGSDDSMAGDIRVSYYGRNANLPNGVNTVYTINDGGRQTVTSGGNNQAIANTFEKYAASRASMQTVLTGSNIYGLHFMDATIGYGPGVCAVAESATVNGNTYENYELPTNCIDFSLKEKGFINFFAGTYFSGNNSFFSLFEVVRDGSNSITNVKRITQVLKDSNEAHSYQYAFDDGTYSVPFMYSNGQKVTLNGGTYTPHSTMGSAYTGYSVVFKTSWIEVNSLTSNYAYYFEIPMNDGEYCLGSVDGGTGAYLMYLDIGANAKKTYRSEIIEYFKLIEELYSYPKGVGIVAAGSQASDLNSFCVCIKSTYNGTLTMQKVTNGDVEEGKYTGAGGEEVTYKYPALTVRNGSNVAQTVEPDSTTVTEIKRMTFFDHDIITNTLNKIIITDTYVGGVKQSRTVEKYTAYNVTTQTGTADDSVKVYIVNGDTVLDYTNQTNNITFNTNGNTTKLLSYFIPVPDGGIINIAFLIKVSETDVDGHNEYAPTGYVITVTLTKQDGVTEDITADCYVTYRVNSDGTYTYTFTINGTNAVAGGDPIEITVTP